VNVPDDQAIGDRLRQARAGARVTQAGAAAALGVPRSAVSALETGSRRLTAVELAKCAALYRRPAGWFLGDESGPARPPAELPHRRPVPCRPGHRDPVRGVPRRPAGGCRPRPGSGRTPAAAGGCRLGEAATADGEPAPAYVRWSPDEPGTACRPPPAGSSRRARTARRVRVPRARRGRQGGWREFCDRCPPNDTGATVTPTPQAASEHKRTMNTCPSAEHTDPAAPSGRAWPDHGDAAGLSCMRDRAGDCPTACPIRRPPAPWR
jgi:DNA-binding XRE family transcriptional regulator